MAGSPTVGWELFTRKMFSGYLVLVGAVILLLRLKVMKLPLISSCYKVARGKIDSITKMNCEALMGPIN